MTKRHRWRQKQCSLVQKPFILRALAASREYLGARESMINGARDSVQSQTRIVTPAGAPVVRIKINSLTIWTGECCARNELKTLARGRR